MNGRMRVLNTFNRMRSDRMPIDYQANAAIHGKLMQHFKASTAEDLLKYLRVDFRGLPAPYAGKLLFPEKEGMTVDPVYGSYTRWVQNEFGISGFLLFSAPGCR